MLITCYVAYAFIDDDGVQHVIKVGDRFRTDHAYGLRNPEFFSRNDTPTDERPHWRDWVLETGTQTTHEPVPWGFRPRR